MCSCGCSSPEVCGAELQYIANFPLEWEKERKTALKVRDAGGENVYLVTYTSAANIEEDLFIKHVRKSMGSRDIVKFIACLENRDTNKHCHAKIWCTRRIDRRRCGFPTYEKHVGKVDLRHVTKDNGIPDYFTGPKFTVAHEISF